MKFEMILPYLKQGKKIRRDGWSNTWVGIGLSCPISPLDILMDDWEIAESSIEFHEALKHMMDGKMVKNKNNILYKYDFEKNDFYFQDLGRRDWTKSDQNLRCFLYNSPWYLVEE
jgi:hypothetical protein